MTTASVLTSLRRRWPVTLLGLALTVGVLLHVYRAPHEYYGQLNIRFLAPVSTANPNVIQTSSSALVQTAGLVKADVNRGSFRPGEALSLTIKGGDDRSAVILPNSGSQFLAIYSKPILSLEVVADDPDVVARRLDVLATRVEQAAVRLQVETGVAPINRISTRRDPAEGQISQLQGHTKRALPVIFLLGIGLTVWVTAEVDAALARRAARRGSDTRTASPKRRAGRRRTRSQTSPA